MSEHTPTPWSYKRSKFPIDGEFDCGIGAVIDGRSYCIGEAVGRCAPNITLPAEANAAFIVKACNSHDALVSALKHYTNHYCEGWCGQSDDCAKFDDCGGCIARTALASIKETAL